MVGLVCDLCHDLYFWHHDQRDWELSRNERLDEQDWHQWNSALARKAGKGSKPIRGSKRTGNGNGGEGKGGSSDDAMNANNNGGGYLPTERSNGGKGKGGNSCDARKGKYNGGGYAPTGKGTVAFARQGENEAIVVIRRRSRLSIPPPQTPPFDMPPNYYDPEAAEALAARGWQLGPDGWYWPNAAGETLIRMRR